MVASPVRKIQVPRWYTLFTESGKVSGEAELKEYLAHHDNHDGWNEKVIFIVPIELTCLTEIKGQDKTVATAVVVIYLRGARRAPIFGPRLAIIDLVTCRQSILESPRQSIGADSAHKL